MDLFNIPHQDLAETVRAIHWLVSNGHEIGLTILGLVSLHFYGLWKIFHKP